MGLREQVKSGELSPKDALDQVKGQPQASEAFIRWCRNKINSNWKPKNARAADSDERPRRKRRKRTPRQGQ